MLHRHHIVPTHAGGTNDESNIAYLTVEEHAEAHRVLYETYGRWEDRIAWKGLAGIISKEEIVQQVLSEAGKRGGRNLNRKGMKYKKRTEETKPIGTIGRKWYHNPKNTGEKKCLLPSETIPDGWVAGQGKKHMPDDYNPGFNFHRT